MAQRDLNFLALTPSDMRFLHGCRISVVNREDSQATEQRIRDAQKKAKLRAIFTDLFGDDATGWSDPMAAE